MRVETTTITKKVLRNINRLDPVTMYLEDLAPGQGKLTIDCFGKVWTAFWGGMGNENIAKFINSADIDYLAGKLFNGEKYVIDYDEISRKIGNEVERETLVYYEDKVVNIYGADWRMDLPTTINPKYEYLCRIITAVKEAIANELMVAA